MIKHVFTIHDKWNSKSERRLDLSVLPRFLPQLIADPYPSMELKLQAIQDGKYRANLRTLVPLSDVNSVLSKGCVELGVERIEWIPFSMNEQTYSLLCQEWCALVSCINEQWEKSKKSEGDCARLAQQWNAQIELRNNRSE